MKDAITYVGIDAHKKDLFIAMLIGEGQTPVTWTVPNEPKAVSRLVRKLEREAPGDVRCCYEAGPCGYALQRQMTTARLHCQVIAPSLIPRKPGERIKTNQRDARKLVEPARKQRCTPLGRDTASVLETRLRQDLPAQSERVFPSIRGRPLSRDAIEELVARHVQRAQHVCPSLKPKMVSPHVLRHSAAMRLRAHGVDPSVIALWLGHESVETTQMYLHADLRLKEQALSRVEPLGVKPSRYRPEAHLLHFLESL